MLHITQYLVILLPFYIIAAENPLLSDAQSSQDDLVDILTIDTNDLQNFFATLRPLDIDYYPSLQEPLYPEPSASREPASPIPSITLSDSSLHSTTTTKPVLLKRDGTPYIRGPYNTQFKKLLGSHQVAQKSSLPIIHKEKSSVNKIKKLTKTRHKPQADIPTESSQQTTQTPKGQDRKRKQRYIKRNIHPNVSSSDPNYSKIYSALYAQVVKQQNPDM